MPSSSPPSMHPAHEGGQTVDTLEADTSDSSRLTSQAGSQIYDQRFETADKPPEYRAELILIPKTADQTRRYDKGPLPSEAFPKHVFIPPGLFAYQAPKTPPLPYGWIELVHPEGLIYFYNRPRRIVTDTNLKNERLLKLTLLAASIIEARAASMCLVLHPTTELVLDVEEYSEPPICRYYMIDHSHRSEFWLEQTTTDRLNMPPVTSFPHLRYLLRQHYWTHVEFFPLHISLPDEVEQELLAILSHACIDFMTSTMSTVPYSQEQCEAYLRLVREIPETGRVDGYRNCVLARLWSEIDSNYFVNLHGEPYARVSRTQALLPVPVVQRHRFIAFCRVALLCTSDHYYDTLSELWVDKISYAAHWRKFMSGNMYTWKATVFLDLLLSISSFSTLSIAVSGPIRPAAIWSQTMAIIAVIFSLASLSASLLLIQKSTKQLEASATDAGEFLETVYHSSYGFYPLSLVYAFPFGACIWSLGFLFLSAFALCFVLRGWLSKVIITVTFVLLLGAGYFTALGLKIGGPWITQSQPFSWAQPGRFVFMFTSWRVTFFTIRLSILRYLNRLLQVFIDSGSSSLNGNP